MELNYPELNHELLIDFLRNLSFLKQFCLFLEYVSFMHFKEDSYIYGFPSSQIIIINYLKIKLK